MLIRERLREVFVKALDLGPEVDVESLVWRGHRNWDSLGHLALIAMIEDEFLVEFDSDTMIDTSSFDRAVAILGELGVADR